MFKFELRHLCRDFLDAKARVQNPKAGGFVVFEGWIRDHNEGKDVLSLEYSAYEPMAIREGEKIIAEALQKFQILDAHVIHNLGHLQIGDIAVWVGVSAVHRGTAFDACEYIIDELKVRVPIWKNEHYADGTSVWVECHECAKHAHHGEHHEHH